jgi:NTP pyrophosphatase (non-canonical NTP hydrolase)
MSWTELEMKVIRWAEDRRIIPNATPVSQLLKAVSEMGELADAEGKRDRASIEDAVGDVLVCLINYCALRDLDMTRCLAGAYEQIKDRRGTLMPDGTFVKEQA